MPWLAMGLVVAVLTAIQDALNKHLLRHRIPVLWVAWSWWTFSLPVVWAAVWILRAPVGMPVTAWTWLSIDVVLLTAAVFCYLKGLKHGDLSQTLPMLALTPVLMLFVAPLFLGERPSWVGAAGVVMIAAGGVFLMSGPFRRGGSRTGRKHPPPVPRTSGMGWMLAVAVIFSVTGTIDKVGVLQSHPVVWVAWLNTVQSVLLTLWLWFTNKRIRFRDCSKRVLGIMIPAGWCNGLALMIQMTALLATQVPYLIAVKRLSLVFAALYGLWRFKEPDGVWRLTWIGVMISGVFLLAGA